MSSLGKAGIAKAAAVSRQLCSAYCFVADKGCLQMCLNFPSHSGYFCARFSTHCSGHDNLHIIKVGLQCRIIVASLWSKGLRNSHFFFCETEAFNPIQKMTTKKKKPVAAERKLSQGNSHWPCVLFHLFWQQDTRRTAPSSEHLAATGSEVKPDRSLWAQVVCSSHSRTQQSVTKHRLNVQSKVFTRKLSYLGTEGESTRTEAFRSRIQRWYGNPKYWAFTVTVGASTLSSPLSQQPRVT